jgi:hypothetical protein
MGGRGSTRWAGYQRKPRLESALGVDLGDPNWRAALERPWAAAGNIEWTRTDTGQFLQRVEWRLGEVQEDGSRWLVFAFSDDLDAPTQVVALERVQVGCSRRWHARCPEGCGRRARKIYWMAGKLAFACWRCAQLQYASAQQHDARVDDCRRDAPHFWRSRSRLGGLRSQLVTARVFLEAERRGLELPDRLFIESMPPEIRAASEAEFAAYRRRLPKRRDRRAGQGRALALE